jgi:hypothetical protein
MERVTPVMKYHAFDGKCGHAFKECKREGVMMDERMAEDMLM